MLTEVHKLFTTVKWKFSLTGSRGGTSHPGKAVGTRLPQHGSPSCFSPSVAIPTPGFGLLFNLRDTVEIEQMKRSEVRPLLADKGC